MWHCINYMRFTNLLVGSSNSNGGHGSPSNTDVHVAMDSAVA